MELSAQSPLSIESEGATLTLAPNAPLHLARGGETMLAGAEATAVAWHGNASHPIALSAHATPTGFVIEAHHPDAEALEFRFVLESGRHWYGVGSLVNQHYPLENGALPPTPFVTWDNGVTGIANLLEPLWLTATGVGIWVSPDAPQVATLSMNAPQTKTHTSEWEPRLNVTRPAYERPFPVGDVGGNGLLTLRFQGDRAQLHVFIGETIREAQAHFIATVGHPSRIPDPHHMTIPIWTTWARYKTEIDQEKVMQYVAEIQAADFPLGTLEIDDRWQTAYGDLQFDPTRFPDPRAMIDALHAQDIQVTAWVIPFINRNANCFDEAAQNGYLVRNPAGEPYEIEWWQGMGYLLDISNPDALMWFRDRLKKLQAETGLDGFKFDAGEACYLQPDAQTMEPMDGNTYNHRYIEFVGEHFPSSDVRSGWRNQTSPLLFREWDKFSLWGLDNGLQSVLSEAITFGLIGYPFVLADMIGGNEYGDEKTDAEMMVRWTQANALLPMIQFSVAPWDFGSEVSDLCRRAADLHVTFSAEFERLAHESVATGYPMVRPLVWAYSHDRETETIWDEFLLGDNWLVAPVVTMGARARDVYFPEGRWRDAETQEVFEGPAWVREMAAPLDKLLYFEKV
jgi:alpha-glucosidase (family GH31 glycosyl hydrolase)